MKQTYNQFKEAEKPSPIINQIMAIPSEVRMQLVPIAIRLFISIFLFTACGPIGSSLENSIADLEIVYQREGGFAGISQTYRIHPDGRIEGPNGEVLQAEPEDVFAVISQAEGMDFFELEESYIPENDCCDQFTYTITVKIGVQQKTVRTSDNGEHPEQLSSILNSLDNLIRSAEPVE